MKTVPMTDARRSTSRAYWLSVFIGSYVAIALQMLITTWAGPIDFSELWAFPVLFLVYGLLVVPFVAIGLALFGLPAVAMLRKRAQEWWVGVLAAAWGCLAGKLMFYAVDHFLFLGVYDILKISILDMGVIYGLPTGLAWWMLHRRTPARR